VGSEEYQMVEKRRRDGEDEKETEETSSSSSSDDDDEFVNKMTDVENEVPKSASEVRLLVFRPDELPADFSMIVYGQRRSGKSNWTLWLMKTLASRFDRVVVFSATLMDGQYQRHVNEKLCFNKFCDRTLQTLIDMQKKDKSDKKPEDKCERTLVVMDDVLDQTKEIRTSPALNSIFTQGRHFNCSIVVLTQHVKAMPPSFRKNVDACVVFRTYSHDMVKGYYEDYGGMMSRNTFFSILSGATNDHKALVLMPCCNSPAIQDYMQLTKADLISVDDDFKIGKQYKGENRPHCDRRKNPVIQPVMYKPLEKKKQG
jgi:hypothetical protein